MNDDKTQSVEKLKLAIEKIQKKELNDATNLIVEAIAIIAEDSSKPKVIVRRVYGNAIMSGLGGCTLPLERAA